jgi:REP element-mobilizing transposase RayT
MARPLRIEFAGAVYHVTSRGNGRQRIFLDDQDNRKFLELLGKTIEHFHWICHAFCLMVNHYHLMIETPEANLSKGMHHLNASFCQAHNKRYDTVGHLFQGRFKSIVVDRESYLLELARYVVLNPVRAGMAARPEDWPWSSYRATAGLPALQKAARASDFLSTTWLLGQFGPGETAARRHYCEFVSSGIGQDSPWSKLQSQLYLGKETFVDQIKNAIPEKTTVKEIPKSQRYSARPPLKEIFGGCETRKGRDEAIVASYGTYGYEQKEIADYLGIHYTTVCRTIRRQEAKR